MKCGYKVKLYPNKTQEQTFLKYCGATRFVYNYFLDRKKTEYLNTGKNLTYCQLSKELTKLRKETDWMKEVQFQPLQQSLRQLDVAYNRFFRKQSKFPNFKKKNGKQSVKKVQGWRVQENKIVFAKDFAIKFRGNIPKKGEGTLTISRNACGQWFASMLGNKEIEQPALNGCLGIDLGLNHLAVTSDGGKFKNNRTLKNKLKKLKDRSRTLSKKSKGSNRRKKAKQELAILHNKIENIRKNHLHHVSKAIVSKNHAVIALEDLSVLNMMKNRRLSRSINDAGWGELIRQITYKQKWIGGKTIKINRFFPSSKNCSSCGFILENLSLSEREWDCPKCKAKHDRDLNAAINIKRAGELLCAEKQ